MMVMMNVQPAANTITFADLAQTAADLGAEAGKGKDTQVKFLLKAVEGGYHNALDMNPSKHGTDVDDATKLTEIYVKAQTGATIFDAKAPNQRKTISCIRTCIKLGGWPKGGNGEPLATVNNLITERQRLRKIPTEAKKLDDAANTLLKYARTQLKRDQLIDDAELKTFCYKPTPDLPTAEDIIERTVKQLDKLIDGSAAHSTAQDNSKEVRDARHALRQRLASIAKGRGAAQGNGAAKMTNGATP